MAIPSTLVQSAEAGHVAQLQLLVIEGESVTVYVLPERGALLVGRGNDADVQLSDPSASARHARVHVADAQVTLEDLGSRNGTHIRGQRLAPETPTPLAAGEAALLGASVLVLQLRSPRARRRRVWPHGYFEVRLAEECEVAHAGSFTFSVARVDVDRSVGTDAFVGAAEGALRPSDIIGAYGPGAFEVMIRRSTPEAAARVTELLLQRLRLLHEHPRAGLAHFPSDGQSAGALIEKACQRVRPQVASDRGRMVVVADERMRDIHRMAERAAAGNINVLILGETGVGKEVLAEAIHKASKRASQPFLCLNCAAFTETLLESELFGYERGAFTDAKTTKAGLLETASGGTVFLDEIGDMAGPLQAKVLRVIETKEVTRIGGRKPIPIDVRFLAATHKDIVQEIRDKRFRSDLYYRLNGLQLAIPPLRERTSEIRPLCEAFLEQLARQQGYPRVPVVSDAAAELLVEYQWPGNIRELRNAMERALLLSDGQDIEPSHLPLEILQNPVEFEKPIPAAALETATVDDDRWNREQKAERASIVEALRAEGGNQTRAAKRLGIARGTLVARLEFYGIDRPRKRISTL